MKYCYFPGCSQKTGGAAYEKSFLAVCKALDIEVEELEDWNCCGATSFMSVEEGAAYALTTRNLALAEKTGLEMIAPCGGCYGILLKADHYFKQYETVRSSVTKGLKAEGLEYKGAAVVRHPLEILAYRLPKGALRKAVKRPLKGLNTACYYGCRTVRPISPFDDIHNPQSMETVLKGVGSRIADFPLKTKCCGGAVTGVLPEAGLDLCWLILRDVQRREGDLIATACPLCQFNIEAYQDEIVAKHPEIKPIPVVYFTQLLGVALGLDPKDLGFQNNLTDALPILRAKGILQDDKTPAGVK